MSDDVETPFKPPYLAFQTFWNFLASLSEHPLPPQIDRSLMGSKSGTDQANLVNALKAFRLVDDDQRVLPALIELTESDADARSALLGRIVRRDYAAAVAVSDSNGTAGQLEQCFRESYGVTGADTLRKSITFFLHAARTAGVPLSPHFKQTRPGSGAPGQPRKRTVTRRTKNTGAAGETPVAQPTSKTDTYRLDVHLRTGGTMTLLASVNPIGLRGEDRAFFFDIVDKMTDYEQPEAGGAQDGREGETVRPA
jgi:hypothetical protein